jgi:hypothetical protein
VKYSAWATLFLVALATSSAAETKGGREWFVREGSEGGNGSQEKPFADPWQALEKCEAGDVLHITGGKYYGKLNQGTWQIPFDGVQLYGGYTKDFKERDPWTHRTELLWDKASKNRPSAARLSSNAKNVVVDGIVIDMKEQNDYSDPEKTSRLDKPMAGEDALNFTQPAIVRNCVLINSENYAVRCPPGSILENNLMLNSLVWCVSIYTSTGDFKTATATVKNNTILFAWTFKAPGQGSFDGSAIQVNGPATITGNIIAHHDSNGIYQTYLAEKVSITKNVFHMNLFSNLKFSVNSRDVAIDNKSMGDLEEVGLKAFEGNEVLDPMLPIDKEWMDLYSRRAAYQPGKLDMDDWNKTRQLLGLPMIAKGGKAAVGVAPAYDLEKAMALLSPKNQKCQAGARRLKLESKVTGAAAATISKTYPKGNLLDWNKEPGKVNEKPLEMVVAIGGVANISSMPSQYKKDQILGYFVYDPEGRGERLTAFMTKGTTPERVFGQASGYYQGGKPDHLFVVRGIAYEVQGIPKAAFYVESVEKYEAAAASPDRRPPGRDWFVRAGSTGGNGSKEKPFKDPFQALERSESGDTIHVTEGEYVGRLKIGTWKIDTSFIALLGGYDKEFKERNPWTHPTLLYCPADFKGRRGGYTIEGEGDHTGAIVDGFVFDKKLNNLYRDNGDVDSSRSDNTQHIWLSQPGCVIRNCVFVNGTGGALRVSTAQDIENNIILNHWAHGITLTRKADFPATIRNNTLLFSWDIKFGQGHGRTGDLLRIESFSKAIVENNIFEFADNDAVVLAVDPADIVFSKNVFSHNLWSNVYRSTDQMVIDKSNWKQLQDLGWKKCEGNELLVAGIPVDEPWFNIYLNRTAYVPGKVQMDDWNKLREILGQPMIATGGKGPEGMMPAYDWKKALGLFPKNAQCKAGARARTLEVKFEGIERKEEAHEYEDSSWDVAKSGPAWGNLAKKRVALKVAIKSEDNQYPLADIDKSQYLAFYVVAPPELWDSGGLPMRCYVKRGTRFERVVRNAKDFATGKPEESYIIKGIAREGRQMVVEVAERAD